MGYYFNEAKYAVEIHHVEPSSSQLDQVIELGDSNSKTLGHFPRGAFAEYAEKEQILAAVSGGEVCGYLLYRTSQQRVIIVHLCIKNNFRKRGIGRELVNALIRQTQSYLGIGLHCRRDYDAAKVWPKLGFSPRYEKDSRGKDDTKLTFWWIDYHKTDLFSSRFSDQSDNRLAIVIDLNVFYDLEFHGDEESKESLTLKADWLSPHLELLITDELFAEIDRIEESEDREQRWKSAREYGIVECEIEAFQSALDSLKEFAPLKESLGTPLSEQSKSDIRHLARTIAAGSPIFVTRDGDIINCEDALYDNFGIRVLRPAAIVTELDSLYGERRSHPQRLSGTTIEVRSINKYQEQEWINSFYKTSNGEKKSEFKGKIRQFASTPSRYDTDLVLANNESMAIIVSESEEDATHIPFLRLSDSKDASTIGLHLVFRTVRKAARSGDTVIRVNDKYLPELIQTELEDSGFVEKNSSWTKVVFPHVISMDEMPEVMGHAKSQYPEASDILQDVERIFEDAESRSADTVYKVERALWPLKVSRSSLPTYIVSIRAEWAQNLVDERMLQEDLFGADKELALNREGVYYRSPVGSSKITSPARILWYVSGPRRPRFSKKIRACSFLDDTFVNDPKLLFRRFRRLGVYRWEDVQSTANNNSTGKVMAIKFSDTELFDNPVPWDSVQNILRSHDCMSQLIQPTRIPDAAFEEIYRIATKR